MSPRTCFVLLALVAALGAGFGPARPAGAETKTPELKPKWKKGDTARYEMLKLQVREADGKEVRRVSTRTTVEIEVIEADPEGSVLRWTQGSTVFDDPKFDDDPSAHALNGILKSLDLDLELDGDGIFTGLRNWKELRGTGLKVRDAVLAQMAKTGTPKGTLDLVRKETDRFFATKESIETAFARQPALLAFPYGREYETGKTVEYDTELPNVLGGDDPFPAKGEYTLKALDKDTATIVFKQSPDPKEMNKVLRKWLEDIAKKTGKPAPKELPELELTDVIEIQFDLASSWAKSVTHTRTARQPAVAQTETLTLTRKAR
jgi:hypothetical protein